MKSQIYFISKFCLLLGVIFSGCEFKKPVLPSWDVEVNFPIINRPYTIDSLIQKDTSLIKINPLNGYMVYSYSRQTESDSVGDKIKLKPAEPIPMNIKTGVIPFRNYSTGTDIPVPGLPRFPTIIPPGNLPPITAQIPSNDQFDYLEFETGIFRLTIFNPLPITIKFNDTIRFVDFRNNKFIFYIDSLPPHGTRQAEQQLHNRTLNPPLKLDTIYSGTPGSGTNQVTIQDTVLKVKIDFLNLSIRSGRAKIPPTNILRVDSAKFVIDSSATPTKLKRAFFKKGIVDLKIKNDFDVTVRITLMLPQLINKNNQLPFFINQVVSRKDSSILQLNFANYEINNPFPTDTLIYSAQFVQLGSEQDTVQFRTFSQNDVLIASIKIHPPPQDIIVASFIEGQIKPVDIQLDTTINIKLNDIPLQFSADSLRFPEAKFILNLTSPNIQSRISGFIRLNDSAHYTLAIPPTIINANTTTPIIIGGDEVVSTLRRYVSLNKNLPPKYKIETLITINPLYSSGSISSRDKIVGESFFEIPSNIGIKGGVFRDTLRMGEDKNDNGNTIDLDSASVDRIQGGKINFTVNNKIPLDSRLSLKLLNAKKGFIQTLPSTGPVAIKSSTIGSDGFSSNPVQSKFEVRLNKQEIDNINTAKYIALEITLNTLENVPSVKFRNTDWINFRVFGTFNYQVKE